MPKKKAVSFVAALDPALLAAGAVTTVSRAGRGRVAAARTTSISSARSKQAADAATHVVQSPSEGRRETRKGGKQSETGPPTRTSQRTATGRRKSQPKEAAQDDSTEDIHFSGPPIQPPPPPKRPSADDTFDDISETIYDPDSTVEAPASHSCTRYLSSASVPRPSSQPTQPSHSAALASLLANETSSLRKQELSRRRDSAEGLQRRTLYGSKRRRLERENRRSIQSPKEKQQRRDDAHHRKDTDDCNGGRASVITSQPPQHAHPTTSTPRITEKTAEPARGDVSASSQQSQLSARSDDGVYHTHFSIFRFEADAGAARITLPLDQHVAATLAEEAYIGPSVGMHSQRLSSGEAFASGSSCACGTSVMQSGYDADQSAAQGDYSHPVERSGTQTGYEADRSASHSTTTQLEGSDQSDAPFRPLCSTQLTHPVPPMAVSVYRPVWTEEAASVQDNSDVVVYTDAERRRIDNLCSGGTDSSQAGEDVEAPRNVYPTIWRGRKAIREHFDSPSNHAYTSKQSPPTRTDVARWAEWTSPPPENAGTRHPLRL